jgi:hypothetical protein
MAKRFFIVLAALAVTAAAAFATGQNEQAAGSVFQGDKLVLKGTVSFQGLPHPVLKTADKQYLLMVPARLVYEAGVKDGTQVTVQGWQLSQLPWAMRGFAGDDKSLAGLFVTQATVNGKNYDLTRLYAERMIGPGRGGYGPGYGMMGGYGPDGDGYRGRPGRMGPGYGYGPGYGMMGGGRGMMGDWD